MGTFGDKIKESETPKQKTQRVKTTSDFLKITPEHSTVIRILDTEPEITWSHFVPKHHTAFPSANAGKGMSFMCPGLDTCPICKWNAEQRKLEDKPKNLLNARKLYTFNVLDRTPVVSCKECGEEHYAVDNSYPEECANPECKASLVDVEAAPRNRVQIFQKGVTIARQFMTFEDEFGDVTSYDIKLDTRKSDDRTITQCIPKPPTTIDMDDELGPDWEEGLYNIKDIVKPMDVENINRILNGEDYYTVFKKD